MKKLLLAAAAVGALFASTAADAALRLSISDGVSTFTCQDGQLGCDLSGGANNLLAVNTVVDGFFVQLTLVQSSFGAVNELQLSSSNITATNAGTLTILASDTSFIGPVSAINNSASLTFNDNVGAGASTLKFWADSANAQGANPNQTPGTLLFTTAGVPTTNPDSFAGSVITPFFAGGPFSMTEGAAINLIAGGSVTGFNQSMQSIASAVPELQTWAMFGVGLGLVALVGARKGKSVRSIA